MNAAKQTLYLFFIFIALAAFGWNYFHETKKLLDEDILSSTVDTTLFQLTVRQFNKEGILTNELSSPFMQHIPKKNIHLFQAPHILISQIGQPSWEIHSKQAKSFHGGLFIDFMKDVVVHQSAGEKTQESTLRTEKVRYYPQEKKASTDLFVTFEQPGNTVQSTGMNAYLDEKRVELLHKARGSYAPAKG